MIVTVEKSGKMRQWGPLSRTTAWRVGCFLEEIQETVKVFIHKDGKMAEVEAEKRIEGGREKFWFNEKKDQPEQQTEPQEPAPEVDQVAPFEEETQEEIDERNKMWLIEKVTSLERENEEMKKVLQEMATRVQLQENMLKQYVELQGVFDSAVTRVCENVQRLNAFTEEATPVINGLVQEVQKHQGNFREVGRILLNHEEHIAKTRTASEQMAQYINALIQESEKNHLWIGNLIKENQEQNQVLRRHEMGQYAIAEVVKEVANKQSQQQPPTATGTQPTITEPGEDGDRLDFTGGPSPQTGPPDIGPLTTTTKSPRAPRPKDDLKDN